MRDLKISDNLLNYYVDITQHPIIPEAQDAKPASCKVRSPLLVKVA